ncbi:alpha/beta fold hydrolase [Nocardioides sp. zg-536]|uniref:Alpha/beta fold hydrolase n=1 Tax=Nocardioides faecalis TaxID=2803858 RepID=A0A939BXH2_9ACTN|nr:alpha/beta fold hydrolase [Nocardioides faecalis]MBM9461727.1 alpha/beta fold hydrolase [Nocardioides faecalis]QVI59909.1 alpha/beta fold hydrolase [Nocardioides faecalis]
MAASTYSAPQDQAGKHELQYVVLHGKRRAYLKAGRGPALLLLHGLGCDHTTWLPVIDELAKRYTVIAPDFLGHGASDKPRADYSVAGYANGMRDLLTVLGIDKATVVGHSFGGGVALQFGYQFPERTQRIVVVATGGFGPEVTPFIKLIQAPGWSAAMGVLTLPGIRHLELAAMRTAAQLPGPARKYVRDLGEVAAIVDSWKDRRTRYAIRHLVRAVIDWRGQVVTIADRAYLTEVMPIAVVWGRDDQVIPVRHASIAAFLAPQAHVEVIPDSGHFPHKDHPEQFVAILNEFIATTEPATYNRARFRRMLKAGGAARPAPLVSVEAADGAPA